MINYIVIVRSDRAVRGWTEEPQAYGPFSSERQAETWAAYSETMAHSSGHSHEYYVSRLQTPAGFGKALSDGVES